jgi:hypothetical protein
MPAVVGVEKADVRTHRTAEADVTRARDVAAVNEMDDVDPRIRREPVLDADCRTIVDDEQFPVAPRLICD